MRPAFIQVPMRPRDWQDLDGLVELSGAPSLSEAMRAAVRAELRRLRREEHERVIAERDARRLGPDPVQREVAAKPAPDLFDVVDEAVTELREEGIELSSDEFQRNLAAYEEPERPCDECLHAGTLDDPCICRPVEDDPPPEQQLAKGGAS